MSRRVIIFRQSLHMGFVLMGFFYMRFFRMCPLLGDFMLGGFQLVLRTFQLMLHYFAVVPGSIALLDEFFDLGFRIAGIDNTAI